MDDQTAKHAYLKRLSTNTTSKLSISNCISKIEIKKILNPT